MLVANNDVNALSSQEKSAATYFCSTYGDKGTLVSVADVASIKADAYDAVWVHIDRKGLGLGVGNLPDGFASEAVANALKTYLDEGGNIYLSKHATQLITSIGRVEASYAPNIFADGDGGKGTDVWTVQAIIGAMNDPANFPEEQGREGDLSQVYNHTDHAIYAGLETLPAHAQYADFVTATYPLLGTGDGSEMLREDHNCMWDLNAITLVSDGKNTTEKFEKDLDCVVIGTWGHVQDYCVAGIVEFNPKNNGGKVIANGLAAYEWAPSEGTNGYKNNIEKLTKNALDYLAANGKTSDSSNVEMISSDNSAKVYYNMQGMQVSESNLKAGIYVVRQGNKVAKQIVK